LVYPVAERYGWVIAGLFIALLALAVPAGAVWKTEIADSYGNAGEYTSLALDSAGNPRISYSYGVSTPTNPNYYYYNLKYAERGREGTWTTTTVDSDEDVGICTSLALDSSGNPHISYYDGGNNHLKYAERSTSGTWTNMTVDSANYVGQYTSLALDGSGNPCISYSDGDNRHLKYAERSSGGTWTITTVDSANNVGWYSSLALDSNGNPHISYYDYEYANRDLKYAERSSGGTWTIATVDSADRVGEFSSLALDSSGNPRISYAHGVYNPSINYDLKYAERSSGGTWTIATVDSANDVGLYSSLALDSNGNPRISYYDATTDDLKYAERGSGGAWTITTADSANNVGTHTSLALDSNGIPSISYYDITNKDLKFARPALVASLSGTPLTGTAPLAVAFTGTAAGTLGSPSWAWSFGDGGSSLGQSPSYTYSAPGTYSVSLTAADSMGVNITTRTAYITVTGAAPATAIEVDPAEPATVYAGVEGQGVYLSPDSGSSWSHLALPGTANLRIRALAPVRPVSSTATTLYAGSYGGGVYRSTDGGTTWGSCGALPDQHVLSLVANSTAGVYAGTESGVFASTDECTSWVAVNNGLP
jgi:PKD repeat protein